MPCFLSKAKGQPSVRRRFQENLGIASVEAGGTGGLAHRSSQKMPATDMAQAKSGPSHRVNI